MVEGMGYQPTPDEINQAEEAMTGEQRGLTYSRDVANEKLNTNDPEYLAEVGNLNVQHEPGSRNFKISGTLKGHEVDIDKQGNYAMAYIDGGLLENQDFAREFAEKIFSAALAVKEDIEASKELFDDQEKSRKAANIARELIGKPSLEDDFKNS